MKLRKIEITIISESHFDILQVTEAVSKIYEQLRDGAYMRMEIHPMQGEHEAGKRGESPS